MSAVGHYLEECGIPTAGISLVREHSEVMLPPRALWVPFMLGRPLGAPDDASFQRTVLRALLSLFELPEGPVLQDFPHDAPEARHAEIPEGGACPVNFARPRPASDDELADRLRDEIHELRSWHDLATSRRGGSAMGLSGLTAAQAGARLAAFAGDRLAVDALAPLTLAAGLKHASDDLRCYYEEAAAAQPGGLSPAQVRDWFYLHTAAGQVLEAVRQRGMAHADPAVRMLCERMLIPRAVLQR